MLSTILGFLSWIMFGLSVLGFGKLLYDERWGRAAIASVLTGISAYIMFFLRG